MLVLGLGSNQGDRLEFIRKAILNLRAAGIQVIAVSPIYESDALLPKGAPSSWNQPYLNLCVLCKTELDPHRILDLVKKIEIKIGRTITGKWGPREIDIDILAYGSQVVRTEDLTIPHAGLQERPFALIPFADLWSNWCWPGQNRPLSDHVSAWRVLPADQVPFRTRRSLLSLSELVAVVNVTPDSFSDGGKHLQAQEAVSRMMELVEEGVQIIDLGAESTRPGATPVSAEEEWRRLGPVLELSQDTIFKLPPGKLKVSLDTRHWEVAERAIRAGVHWINDVTGLSDPQMRKVVAGTTADVVMMHHLGLPPSQAQVIPLDQDPVDYLIKWGEEHLKILSDAGIDRERVIFDPGIGFGKTKEQCWQLLREVHRFHDLGIRILIGHSRKSFLSSMTTVPVYERDPETTMVSHHLIKKGIQYLRIHNTQLHWRVLKTWSQVDGIINCG